jgi:hypothetical protein
VKEQVCTLPDGSVAVTATVVTAMGNAWPLGYVDDTVTTPPELSVVAMGDQVATDDVGPPLDCDVNAMLAGHVTVGFSSSTTVTVYVHDVAWPAASVAVLVMVVVPIGSVAGDAVSLVTAVTPTLSVAVATLRATVRVAFPTSVVVCTFAGHEMAGASLSTTLITKEQVAVLPAASTAVYVTVVGADTGNAEPDECVLVSDVTAMLSVAVGAVHEAVPVLAPGDVLIVCDAGQLIRGLSLSSQFTVKTQAEERPEVSNTVNTTAVFPMAK